MKASDWVLKPMIREVRRSLYRPVEMLSHLPVDPLRYVWFIRLVVALDAPLRRVLLGGTYAAKSS